MVTPLGSLVAGLGPQTNAAAQIGDIFRQSRVTNSNLQSADLQRQAMQQQMGFQSENQAAQRKQLSQDEALKAATYVNKLGKRLLATDESQWGQILQPQLPALQALGYDPRQLAGMTREQVQSVVAQTDPIAQQAAGVTAEQKNRNQLLADLRSSDDQVRRSAEIALGLTERAGTASARERIATDQNLTKQVSGSEAQITGAKEAAKLSAQYQLKPQVEAAVASAVGSAKMESDIRKEDRSNQRAMNIYDTAMNNLVQSLGGTTTGPGVGWLPAVTADQQIAEGAMAAMAPVLKTMFRASGEGTFTDKDQELLLRMVPTRNDLPEARAAKVAGIDAIVRAKLGSMETESQPPAPKSPPGGVRFLGFE